MSYLIRNLEINHVFSSCSSHNVEHLSHDVSYLHHKLILIFAYAKTKVADQLLGNCVADQLLCFHYKDGTILLPPKAEM